MKLSLPYCISSHPNLQELRNTWVPLETGRKRAPAPATLAFALIAIDGMRDPMAVAER